jgi:poly [ADP-ribose] polymerase
MTSLNYDANKLPLGKLSENTLRKGNSALKEISNVLAEPSLAKTKYGLSSKDTLATLTSRYYTIIPHVFGRHVPPIIDNVDRLKKEAELIESLGEMEIATEIINNVSDARQTSLIQQVAGLQKHGGERINVIDQHFESLQLEEFSRRMFNLNPLLTLS